MAEISSTEKKQIKPKKKELIDGKKKIEQGKILLND